MNGSSIGARDRATLALVATFPLATTRTLALLAGYGTARDGWRALDRLREARFVTAIMASRDVRLHGARWWPTRAGHLFLADAPTGPAPPARHPDRPPPRLLSGVDCRAREARYRLASALLLATDSPVRLRAWEPGCRLSPEALPAAIGRGEMASVRWPALLGFHTDGVAAAHEFLLLPVLCPAALSARWRWVLAAWSALHALGMARGRNATAGCDSPSPPTTPRLIVATPPSIAAVVRGILLDAARVLTWSQVDAVLGRAPTTRQEARVTIEPTTMRWEISAQTVKPIVVGVADEGEALYAAHIDDRGGRILGLLARHPFLTAAEIATLQDLPLSSTRRLCGWLSERGLLRDLERDECIECSGRARHLEATRDGLTLAARREGLSLARALAREGFAGGGPGDPLGARTRLLATFAHTRGCVGFVVALVRAGRAPTACRWHLLDWRNVVAAGLVHARPDAALTWWHSDDRSPAQFWLEFDRGTERGDAPARKFRAYAREMRDWGADQVPTLLIVTTSRRAEARLAALARRTLAYHPALGRLPILLSTTTMLISDPSGPLGVVWRDVDEDAKRRCLIV